MSVSILIVGLAIGFTFGAGLIFGLNRISPSKSKRLKDELKAEKLNSKIQAKRLLNEVRHSNAICASLKSKEDSFDALAKIASSRDINYISPATNNGFLKEVIKLEFNSTIDNNLSNLRNELFALTTNHDVEVTLNTFVVGSWKKHLRKEKWLWGGDSTLKINNSWIESKHMQEKVFIGPSKRVIEEIKSFYSDPYWSLKSSKADNKWVEPNAPISFSCKVRLSNSVIVKPEVQFVEVAIINEKVNVIEKIIFEEKEREESALDSNKQDLQALVRAAVEVELASNGILKKPAPKRRLVKT